MRAAAFLGLGLACYGAAKGYLAARVGLPLENGGRFRSWLRAPINEELMFRAGLNRLVGPVAGSVLFGLDHGSERQRYPKLRVADATACGLALSGIHVAGGLPLAMLAHSAHNVGVDLGAWIGEKLAPGVGSSERSATMCDPNYKPPKYAPIPGPLDKREAAALAYAQKAAAKLNQELGVGTPSQPAWWLWTEPRVNRDVWIGGPPSDGDFIPFPEVVIYEDTDWLSQNYGWDSFKWPSAKFNRGIDAGPRPRLAFDANSPHDRPDDRKWLWPMFAHSTRATIQADVARSRAKSAERLAEMRPYSVEYASRRVILEPGSSAPEIGETEEVYIGDWNGD